MYQLLAVWFLSGLMAAPCMAETRAAPGGQPKEKEEGPQVPPPKKLSQITGFQDWVVSLAFSHNGKLLAAGSYDLIKLWDVDQKKVVKTVKIRNGYAKSLTFSPDDSLLVIGTYQLIEVYSLEKGRRLFTLPGHRGYVNSVVFSPDGKTLGSTCDDRTARLWDFATKKEILKLEDPDFPFKDLEFSPDGQYVATSIGDENRVTKKGFVKPWERETGKLVQEFPPHLKVATSVAFSDDGKYLISTSEDEKANVYDIPQRKAVGFYSGHSRPTTDAVMAADNRTVISGSGGRAKGKNEVKVWDCTDGNEWTTFEPHKERINAVVLSPDETLLVTASNDKTVLFWEIAPVLKTVGEKLGLAPAEEGATEKNERKPVVAPRPQVLMALPPEKLGQAQEGCEEEGADSTKEIRVGIIGLDTSHVTAFTKVLNDENALPDVANCKVVAAYPKGSPDILSSTSRVPKYTEQMKAMGVEIVDSIPALIEQVDAVLLETNDGRPHLEQILPVLAAGKPVFIDKPIAGSLTDAVAIFQAAKHYNVPVFSSSSLRYTTSAQELRSGEKIGRILGCDAYSPCSLEKTHPDLFWYGIHGVETLFTVMGTGCVSVTRSSAPGMDVVVGTWKDGRIGTFRGIRTGKAGYGGTAFGERGIVEIGPYEGYRGLVVKFVEMFRTGKPAVSERETLELYAFMEAADVSKKQGGVPVKIETVLKKAEAEATEKLKPLLERRSTP